MMNIDEILNYKKPKETYYNILGCDQSSSIEQISREYKIKALQLHPDKNPDPDSLEKFRRIQTAKDVLCDGAARKSYDCWLNSRINVPFEQWRNKKGHTMHWATPRSTKLSIKEGNFSGQGSDFKLNNDNYEAGLVGQEEGLLDKFRRYEI